MTMKMLYESSFRPTNSSYRNDECHEYPIAALYRAWLTEDNHPCLAKVIKFYVKQTDVRAFFGEDYNKNIHGHGNCLKIQVGPSNEKDIENNNKDSNILILPQTDLIDLPVPIDCRKIIARNKINILNQSNRNAIKWIINETDYNDGYKICMNALQFAKTGNWDEFQQLNAKCQAIGHDLMLDKYTFFDDWSILDEANAHHQTLFCQIYFSKFSKYGYHFDPTFETACKYGHLTLLESDFIDKNEFDHIDKSLHFVIDNNHYNILKWFINENKNIYNNTNNNNNNDNHCTNEKYKRRKTIIDQCLQGLRNNRNILGTAIENNNLKMVKLIIEWNHYIGNMLSMESNISRHTLTTTYDKTILEKEYNQFNVDNFVWCDQTAIQAAFLLCNDNFELIKYLLNKHNPKYKKYSINKLNENDKYIEWETKKIQNRARIFKKKGKIHRDSPSYCKIKVRIGLIGLITYKPDCEGYTIQDRIHLSKRLNILTDEQCDELQKIYDKKISEK